MAKKSDRPPKPGLLQGDTTGRRIRDLIDRYFDGNVSEFARRVGKPRRMVAAWIATDPEKEKVPDGESLRRIAVALRERVAPVTLEELLGAAIGMDPPFEGWREFIATDLGKSMTPEERRSLQLQPWFGKEPTAAQYQGLLLLHRMAPDRAT